MATNLYDKLSDMALLRRAWHLARESSKTDFMFDPYRYSDFAFHLEDHLKAISQNIANRSYHPKPSQAIDVPKSSLSVRPGSVLEIEDKIVLFAIAYLIASKLDKKLSANVYSWRVKPNAKDGGLFHDHEILKIPFLKRQTIQRKIQFVEPWYDAWPRFIEEMEHAYEREGYKFLVVSDIVSYFENVDLELLRDLLLRDLARQPEIVNFLIRLLEYWAWRPLHRYSAPRGLPQGNGVSSFLGNIYLLPLDRDLLSLAKRRKLKYFRYMDDVKVLAKDMPSAREALFNMNERLRGLGLNIQAAKTHILEGGDVREELFDGRLEAVNEAIDAINRKRRLSRSEEQKYLKRFKEQLKTIKGKKGIIQSRELRLFRRLTTGFRMLQSSAMVRIVLDQLGRNPDSKLLNSSVRYLRAQDRNLQSITRRTSRLLVQEQGLFHYQTAHFLMTLRYMRTLPKGVRKEAQRQSKLKNTHWYVRQQAVLLLGLKKMDTRELRAAFAAYKKESHVEVRRAWVQVLAQLPRDRLDVLVKELLFFPDSKLQRLGRFYYGLLHEKNRGLQQVKSIFNQQPLEDTLLERMFEVEILSKAENEDVRKNLLKLLRGSQRKLHRPMLKARVRGAIDRIKVGIK